MPVYIRKGDNLPKFSATLKNLDGTPIDLTGATVKLKMKKPGGATLDLDVAINIVSAAAGTVDYTWTTSGSLDVGPYEAYCEITYTGSGDVLTVPTLGFIEAHVLSGVI